MKWIRKSILKSVVVKEFKQVLRDRRMIGVLFGSPIIMLLIFGYAANTDVTDIGMVLIDEDRSSASRDFVRRFTASGYFHLVALPGSPAEASGLMDRGVADIMLHIGRGFSSRVKSGRGAEVQLVLDGTDSSRASVIMSYVNRITGSFSFDYFQDRVRVLALSRETGGMRMKQSIALGERALFNPDLASRNFLLPGVLGLLIALITIMLTSMSVVKERETGTMEQLVVSPLRPVEFVAGKTLPFAIIGFADIVVVALIAIAWFGVPFNGSFVLLLFSGILFILSTLAVGLYISTVSRTQQQAMLSTFLFFVPAILFSGFVFPIYAMPAPIQAITLLNPLRFFITIIRGIFLKGAGIGVLWPEMLALLTLGAALLFFSVRRFSSRME
ncbi:MAG: ABC transporter permease [Spirochaetes bacterium]|jgi:ABC-2 type transport system permease protein|nr:ABC transporter permease [Spirochaetota bacterium]